MEEEDVKKENTWGVRGGLSRTGVQRDLPRGLYQKAEVPKVSFRVK